MNELEAHEYQVWLNDSLRVATEKCFRIINNLIDNCPANHDSRDNTSEQYIKECVLEAIYNSFGDTIQGMENELDYYGYSSESFTVPKEPKRRLYIDSH